MVEYDGHEVSIATTAIGGLVLLNRAFPNGWIKSTIHRQPAVAMVCFWGILGISLPLIVPPIRRAFKMNTYQYDAGHVGHSKKNTI